ncbi:hypothetical protein J5289_27470 (plasmid) [Rhizobium sp. B230/85]|uniref:hypothetical protein n=1 Tax=unclassified Rhizobium TaxID=2613769 RepID=UPI001ADA1EF8|nr:MULTISPECIES: hypothetical protein [unclassified Rhizobium]MBO9136755.1 hypothetical protein [Rhizobium sp. B209b/85]QXZ99571.1 hypothetical protein J5289_27470 [Rhizobium sp. B230/85]
MKSPWKYLAQLVSRQRSSETAGEQSAPNSARKLVEIELRPATTILLSSPEATSEIEGVREGKPEDRVTAPVAIDRVIDPEMPDLRPDATSAGKSDLTKKKERSNADPVDQPPAGEVAVQVSELRQARLKTAKKERIGSLVEIPGAFADLPISAASSNRDPFFENVASLDEEIKHLKDLLVRKLRIQNAQLREMLKRFERS